MRRAALLALGILAFQACATAQPPAPPAPGATAPPETGPGMVKPPPVPPRARQALAAPHAERARRLESDGRLRAALLEWKIARTIDPEDPAARDAEATLAARIEAVVTERVNEARASLQRGAHVEARRRLLSALALDPSNAIAFGMLRHDVKDVEFVLHTVRPGESLASLAQRYYGDRARLEVIWETNQLPPGRGLAVGTVLKIPEIPGVPFHGPRRRRPPPPPEPGREDVARPAPVPEPPAAAPGPAPVPAPEAPPEVNPLLAEAREAAEKREYAVALADLDRFLGQNPGHAEGVELRKLVLYRQGQALLEQKNYGDSFRTLSVLARLQPDYEDVATLLKQARRSATDRHYQEGLRLFRAERLAEAIREWRIVLEFDPEHANARRNIEQAERLQRGLERRRNR